MRDRLGIVSNCWRVQLDEGSPIEALIERSLKIGLRHFELRQGSLGDCETCDRVPLPDRLAKVTDRFVEATFDLAVEMPVVTGAAPFDVDFAKRCVEAVVALASPKANSNPHLRIVDLAGSSAATGPSRANCVSELERLFKLLRQASASAVLSLEHSRQPWPGFRDLFDAARSGVDLKLCFDPCNLWLCDDEPPVEAILDSISVETISMLHVKQRDVDSPSVLTGLDRGLVPWPDPLRQLERAGYAGPILLETAPCHDVFDQTETNCRRLEEWLGV